MHHADTNVSLIVHSYIESSLRWRVVLTGAGAVMCADTLASGSSHDAATSDSAFMSGSSAYR